MNAVVPFRGPSAPVPAFAVSDMERIARAFAASKLFGVQNEEQALALCLVAQAEGRHPASAAQDYHIISGRPAKKADAMLRDFLSSGGKVDWHCLDDARADATFAHPSGGSVRIAWDHERAKAAGINNPMWRKYPRQMLRSRVVSEGVRTVCPGATSGMYVPEEVQDFAPEPQQITARVVDDEPDFTGTVQPPKPKAQSRETFSRLNEGMRDAAKGSEADLAAWYQANADDVGSLPHDWKSQLRNEYGDHLRECRNRAALEALYVAIPEGECPDWTDYVEAVAELVSTASDEAQVYAAQTANATGLTMASGYVEGVAERIAEAADQRLAALSVAA